MIGKEMIQCAHDMPRMIMDSLLCSASYETYCRESFYYSNQIKKPPPFAQEAALGHNPPSSTPWATGGETTGSPEQWALLNPILWHVHYTL